jgi:hypothetical protein
MTEVAGITTIHCANWASLIREFEQREHGWLFRGQHNEDWKLETLLERYSPDGYRADFLEMRVLREFKRRAHLHLPSHFMPTDTLEWLALMQHWGAPTRLLDVTVSPYVAAYFAVEEATAHGGCCAIWAFDETKLLVQAGHVLKRVAGHSSEFDDIDLDNVYRHSLIANRIAERSDLLDQWMLGWHVAPGCVLPVLPGRFSERLTLQQGRFLCPGNPQASFMDLVATMQMPEGSVVKFVLPNTQRGLAMQRLRAVNISRETLFPGLDGLARSLRYLPITETKADREARQTREALLYPKGGE